MRVFITGASGFIGSALTRELLSAGHRVIGLARSDESAAKVKALGAAVHRGDITDAASVIAGADAADATVHLAFNHDFTRFAQNSEDERRMIEALGSALASSGKPLVATSGVLVCKPAPGEPATEDSPIRSAAEIPRAAGEATAAAAVRKGCNLSIVRLPQVHDRRHNGLIAFLIAAARDKGVSVYFGEGTSHWAAAHISDVARLYRLALDRAEPGAIYHAVGEAGVPMRAIAETIGGRLGVPVASLDPAQAEAHFGTFAHFATSDLRASSEWTRRILGWEPTGPGLLEDLAALEFEPA